MKLAKDFECCPLGEIYPRMIPAGEECPPELEESARALGLLATSDTPPSPPPGNDGSQGAGEGGQQEGEGAGGRDSAGQGEGGGQQSGEGGAPARTTLPPRRAAPR